MEVSPQPPQHDPIVPMRPERSGVFERWFKKRRQNEGGEVSSPPQGAEQRKAPLKPEKPAPHIARNALRVLGLERPTTEPEPAPAQAEHLPTPPEQLQLEETVDKARFMGRATLRFVRGLLRRESTQPPSIEAETPALILRGAENDLGSALGELEVAAEALPGHNSPEAVAAPSVAAAERGDGFAGFAAEAATPETRPAPSLASHAAELQPLLETKEKISSALAVAGLGVIAVGATVLLAWEARRAAREQRRFEKERRKDRRLLEAQEAQLREQEEALRYLKQSQQVAAPEKPAYLRQVGEFTHQQAVVTRQVAREVQEYAEQARPNGASRPAEVVVPVPRHRSEEVLPAANAITPEQTKPLAKVETADIFEQTPGSGNSSLQSQPAGGGAAASGGKLPAERVPVPAASSSAPSLPSPAALRHQAMAKQQRTQFAWLAGIGLAVTLALTALAYILF